MCTIYSPDGREFATSKEVSTYLQSILEFRSKNPLNSLQSHKKTNENLVGNSDYMDYHVIRTKMNQNLESKRKKSCVGRSIEMHRKWQGVSGNQKHVLAETWYL